MAPVRRHPMIAALVLLGTVSALTLNSSAATERRINFFVISQDEETDQAGHKLVRYLQELWDDDDESLILDFKSLTYGAAVDRLSNWNEKDGDYIAHITPYACVAAQMLGAKFEVLATYKSRKTGETTYHSYFVVNKEQFASAPNLEDLMGYLRRTRRAKFIYHKLFSTSSYFLPSLYLRSQRIFETDEPLENITPIEVAEIPEKSSSKLVEQVAEGKADLAAVWDGTKNKYEDGDNYRNYGSKVHFIELPTALPNDLLVSSASLPRKIKQRIQRALSRMKDDPNAHIDTGDILWWEDIRNAFETRAALATLRRLAVQQLAPVTVTVAPDPEEPPRAEHLEAAKQAVRLSGSEFILRDPDFHLRAADAIWTLTPIHDGAIFLKTDIKGSGLAPQEFQISFTDTADLLRRIGALIHSRMHRIRYIWLYRDEVPTLIRDFDFPVVEGSKLKAQKITWTDLDRLAFVEGKFFDATVTNSNFFKIELDKAEFDVVGNRYDFRPMGNVAWRVVLVRLSQERLILRALTVIFIVLLTLAAVGLVLDVRRKEKAGAVQTVGGPQELERINKDIVEGYHRPWGDRDITEADVLWCNRPRLEELIAELKAQGLSPGFDTKSSRIQTTFAWAKLPFLKGFLGGGFERQYSQAFNVDPAKVGDFARLGALVNFLVRTGELSPFIGEPSEWDALDSGAHQWLRRVGAPPEELNGDGDELLRHDSELLQDIVSEHFSSVLESALRRVSFFCQSWKIGEEEGRYILSHRIQLRGGLEIQGEEGTLRGLTLEFNLPEVDDVAPGNGKKVDAWILGKLVRQTRTKQNRQAYLSLHFRGIAVLRDAVE